VGVELVVSACRIGGGSFSQVEKISKTSNQKKKVLEGDVMQHESSWRGGEVVKEKNTKKKRMKHP